MAIPIIYDSKVLDETFGLNKALQEINVDNQGRWILNHGTPLSLAFLCHRINTQIAELEKTFSNLVLENPYATTINIQEPKTDLEKTAWELYHLIKIDVFLFYTFLRSLFDEFNLYVIQPNIKGDGAKLRNSFNEIRKANAENPKWKNHCDFIDNTLQPLHKEFGNNIRDTRDILVHHSAQINMKRSNTGQYFFAILTEDEIMELNDKTEDPRLRWKPFESLNELIELTFYIFGQFTQYIKTKKSQTPATQ